MQPWSSSRSSAWFMSLMSFPFIHNLQGEAAGLTNTSIRASQGKRTSLSPSMPCGCGIQTVCSPTSSELERTNHPSDDGNSREWYVVPASKPTAWSVGDSTYVTLRSEKDTGRARVIGCEALDGSTSSESRFRVRFECCGLEAHVRRGRMVPILSSNMTSRVGIVVENTSAYRKLARSEVTRQDFVVEFGSSMGLCTKTLWQHARWVIGVDNSKENVTKAREDFPWIQFERMDPFVEPERVVELARGYNVFFVDIGGNRELDAVVRIVQWIEKEFDPRLVVVKSQAMFETLMGRKKGHGIHTVDEKGKVIGSQDWWRRLEGLAIEKWYHHPLKAPRRTTNTGRVICRYHNYASDGCKKRELCMYDHETCHLCLKSGHVATKCPLRTGSNNHCWT